MTPLSKDDLEQMEAEHAPTTMDWTARGVTEETGRYVEIRNTHLRPNEWTILIGGEEVEVTDEVHYRDGGSRDLTTTKGVLGFGRKLGLSPSDRLDGERILPVNHTEEVTMIALALKNQDRVNTDGMTPEQGVEALITALHNWGP
jgi:hypothetical protein